jgi:hypothetical protein
MHAVTSWGCYLLEGAWDTLHFGKRGTHLQWEITQWLLISCRYTSIKSCSWRNISFQSDLDTATKELLNKIATIWKIILKDSVNAVITPAQWKRYWAIINKETSSSEPSLHFGHCIVGCKSNIIAQFHAAWVTVFFVHAIQLERWSWGLSNSPENAGGDTGVKIESNITDGGRLPCF